METINMFKPGDLYIHFTNYGGVNRGVVERIDEHFSWDTGNLCIYAKYKILTTKGISLNLDGSDGKIYKVTEEMSVESAKSINRAVSKASAMKSRPHKRTIHDLNED